MEPFDTRALGFEDTMTNLYQKSTLSKVVVKRRITRLLLNKFDTNSEYYLISWALGVRPLRHLGMYCHA